MRNLNGRIIYQVKVISFTVVLMLLSSLTHAQESEGLIGRAYKKFVEKGKKDEQNPVSKPENTVSDTAMAEKREGVVPVSDFYKNMSKAEMIQDIKSGADSEAGILDQIPELKKQKDEDGKDAYSYLVEGKQVNLEEIDENVLRDIVLKVSSKGSQIRADAVLEQQEQLDATRPPELPPPQPPRPPRAPERPPALPRR